ncbi:MAG: radical SAM family heme chaperone HemW [Planctomycetaceae bacterium]|nr:radical SAM family heme chaperone HemW [Planctomycetaceae bacterium]
MACKKKGDRISADRAKALYIHVPFCLRKCRYCDFFSVAIDPRKAARFVCAAGAEMEMRLAELAMPAESIFVGGGTPTALGAAMLEKLLAPLSGFADADTEFSVEANPCSLNDAVADVLAAAGVNRVSIGVQSLADAELTVLGRPHKAADVARAVETVRRAGIENISLDLIYGVPGQDEASWRRSLKAALALKPAHMSCYALSVEEGTPLAADVAAGRLQPADEQTQKNCYYAAIETLAAAGLEHYEISNFARPGNRCRHNLTYWHNRPYLGIGPAAASYVAGIRRTNAPDLEAYLTALEDRNRPDFPPASAERLAGQAAYAETLMLGLRLIEGISRRELSARFGCDPIDAFPQAIKRYASQGALVVTGETIRIAREYFFVADTILADIIAEADSAPPHGSP